MGNIGLISSHGGLNGAAKMVDILARGLANGGHNVRLYHRENAWFEAQDYPANVELRPVDIGVRMLNKSEINRVRSELLDWNALCLHSHGTSADRFNGCVRVPGQLAGIATAHARILHLHWRKHDWIIAPSDYTRSWYQKTHLGRADRMSVIPNAMEATSLQVHPHCAMDELRDALGLPKGKFLILMIGSICHRKNQSAAIPMLKALVDQGVDAHLVVVGPEDRKESAKLKSAIAKARMKTRVHLMGLQEDMDRFVGASDCVLSTSRDEQASVSLLETLAGGRPAVSSRTGSAPEVIQDGKNGQVFDLKDMTPAIVFMRRLAKDQTFAAECGAQARRDFEANYTTAPFIAAHLALYEKLAAT